MRYPLLYFFSFLALSGCATDAPPSASENYEELDTVTVIASPPPVAGRYHPSDRYKIDRGAYLIELLGCGSCHTNGAFDGEPEMEHALAGSDTGIAFSNPLGEKYPGIIYPSNITPDEETGIGAWSDQQITDAIRAGAGRHGSRRIVTMPWQGYSRLTDDDVAALVAYLRSIKPINYRVPKEVAPGKSATSPFVYFGVYRSKR
jgi:hypothetical protein